MRLQEIANILNNNLRFLDLNATHLASNNDYQIVDLTEFRRGIDEITKTKLFQDEINLIKNTIIYRSTLDSLRVSQQEYALLHNNTNLIKSGGEVLAQSIDNLSVDNDFENTISIKLPDNLDFESLGKIIDQLKKSLSLPLADAEINDNIEIKAFESGSFWIDILVHAKESVYIISAITWAGAYIYRQSLEGKKHIQYVESLKIKNELLHDLREATKKQLDIMVEAEALNLEGQYYNGNEPERLERLKLSIETMAELIQKGTEIHPSLLASDNTSSMFPSFKNLNQIESKTKQIEKE